MKQDILAIDVGTSALKLGVFSPELEKRRDARRVYEPHLDDQGKADIDPETWWLALRECCAEIRAELADVGVVALSVTTPGLTPMAADGTALAPAVLFLDGRAHEQSAAIRKIVGEERFLAQTCNLPVSEGSVCLLDRTNSLLLSGDTLFAGSWGRTDLPGGSEEQMAESLSRLVGLDDRLTVLPGHGAATTIGAERHWLEWVRANRALPS